MICACIASNNSLLLSNSLRAYSEVTSSDVVFCVVDTPESHAANAKTISRTDARVLHVDENQFRKSVPEPFRFLFSGRYGGIRNIGLAFAFRESANCVFLDDDTRPANDVFPIYRDFFSQRKQIVTGKYLGHASIGAFSLLLSIIDTLQGIDKGGLSSSEASRRLIDRFCGIPEPVEAPLRGTSFAGGNLGVSLETLSRYCFFPTSYRIEDGAFCTLAPFYGFSVFTPLEPPLVFHEKKKSSPSTLYSNLLNEAKGSVVGFAIQTLLETRASADELTAENIQEIGSNVFRYALLKELREKTAEFGYAELVQKLVPALAPEFSRLLSLTPEQITPPLDEVRRQAALFLKTQTEWPAFVESMMN